MPDTNIDNSWYHRNQRRRAQKQANPRGWAAGHRLRKQTIAYPGKGEKFITCQGGAFGNLATFHGEAYREWALGTDGSA